MKEKKNLLYITKLIGILIVITLITCLLPLQTVSAASVSLSKTMLILKEGKKETLTVKNLLEGSTVSWKSTSTKIARVSTKGKITAVAPGTCIIKATVKDSKGSKIKTLTCKLTVKASSAKTPTDSTGKDTSKSAALTASYTIVHDAAQVFDGNGIFVHDDGYGFVRGTAVNNDNSIELEAPTNEAAVLNTSDRTVRITTVLSITEVPSKGIISPAFYSEKECLYKYDSLEVKANDVVTFVIDIDIKAWNSKYGKGVYNLYIYDIVPTEYVGKDGKTYSYDSEKTLAKLELSTSAPGSVFRLSSDKTCKYSYAGGKAYGVSYNFELETGDKRGKYTMVFPYDGGSDSQTFSVDANSVYIIEYTYGLEASRTNDYEYTFIVELSGPANGSIELKDKHPGKIKKGTISIIKSE